MGHSARPRIERVVEKRTRLEGDSNGLSSPHRPVKLSSMEEEVQRYRYIQ
jgi:hypothetical protein